MKYAYADPPYLGKSAFNAKHYYGKMHVDAVDYDKIETHKALVDRLCAEFDGWALSLHTPSLKDILNICPDDVRIGAWTKSFASFKPNVNPAYTWEPVIFRGCRKKRDRRGPKIRDYCNAPIPMIAGFPGEKPGVFCWWVFDMLGMRPEDEFTDIFPGSGAVSRAYLEWKRAYGNAPLFPIA